jgi:S-DNA-T family DNA segregation ATPase FtsK/SpoIIIE
MGVEITSKTRPVIGLRAGLESPEFASSTAELPVVVGIGSDGRPVVDDLSKSPHVLLAGQSGGGKSVQLASILASLHYACTAKQLRIIGIDCKQVELTRWEASPLMMGEVVTTADDAIEPLTRAVEEMEQRNTMLRAAGVTNLKAYNKSARKPLARWLVVVDEMADLLLSNKKQAEKITDMLTRLGQKGRSAGIHLVLCTQRPEVAVIPGIIKANMPDRWAMRVASAIDSRVILDQVGAEKLNGAGDMLRVNSKGSCHVQGLYVDDENTPQLICAALNKRSQQEAA